MQGTELLPAEFLVFIKVAAALGFFAAIALVITLEYRGFKKILGEEKAKKYRLLFVLGNALILLIVIFIFSVIFRAAKIQFGVNR